MKTHQWRKGAWESASSCSGAMNPSHGTCFALCALLFIAAIPSCTGAPVFLDPSATENEKLHKIDNACSSLFPEERPIKTQDTLWDLCDLMWGVMQKSQDLAARETTKRSTVFHPLLQLVPQLHNRRSRRVALHESPRLIQSRGYFLYRPRNGRRSTEYV